MEEEYRWWPGLSHRSRTPGWQIRPMKVRAAARLIRQSRRHQRLHFRSSRPTDRCCPPKLRKTLNPVPLTMLQAAPHAIHFKRILNFGEGQTYFLFSHMSREAL